MFRRDPPRPSPDPPRPPPLALPPRTLVYDDDASRIINCNTPDTFIQLSYYDDNLLGSQVEWGTGDYGDGLHRTINYGYDADGNRAQLQYPSIYSFNYA